jgi:hypothetical protein
MKCPRHKLKLSEVIFLYLEIIFIMFYLTGTILQLYYIFKINYDYISALKYYYFFAIHNRLIPSGYSALIKETNHTYVNSIKGSCPANTNQLAVMGLNWFKGIKLKDVTETTLVYDSVIYWGLGFKDPHVFNTTEITDKRFYQFDLSQPGEEDIHLLTRYTFTSWKGNALCTTNVKFNDMNAVKLIDKSDECVANLNNPKTMDCGVYLDTYRLCIQYDRLRLNNTYLVSESNIDIKDICPYSHITVNDKKYINDLGLRLYKRIELLSSEVERFNKHFFISIDNTYLTDYQNITNADDIFPYGDETAYYTFKLKEKYGYVDPFSKSVDSIAFSDLYNYTYYSGSVDGLPDPMMGYSGTYYYLTDMSKQVNVNLNLYTYPIPSIECYNSVISKNPYYLALVGSLSTNFLTESINTIIAWLFIKLFIAIYWQVLIRIHAILGRLKYKRLNAADRESDFITKLTGKLVEVIMFLILFYGSNYQRKQFEKIMETTTLLINGGCFTDKIIVNSLRLYSELIFDLNNSNRYIYITLVVSICCEAVLLLYYFYEFLIVKKFKLKDV